MPQYDTSTFITDSIANTQKAFSISEVWVIISILLAIIGGIFIFINYFGKDRENSYTGLKKVIYDFLNFKITIIEPIFKVMYFVIAIAITLSSFSYLSQNFFKFITVLVFGNIIARLSFEFLLLVFKLFKDVSEINNKLVKKDIKVIKKEKKKETEE